MDWILLKSMDLPDIFRSVYYSHGLVLLSKLILLTIFIGPHNTQCSSDIDFLYKKRVRSVFN